MKYSIGEFAEMIGVTTDTLRLYEKYNIVNPVRDEYNNYRYYDDLDVRNVLWSRWYRSFQVPLEEVSVFVNSPTIEKVLSKFSQTKNDLEIEIKEKMMLLNKITEVMEDIKKIDDYFYKCIIKKTPGIYRLKQTYRNTLLDDERIRDTVDEWMGLLPYTFFSFKIDKAAIFSGNECLEYTWGLGIKESEIENFNIEISDYIEYIPPKTCVSSIILSRNDQCFKRDLFQFMIDYIEKNRYFIEGDIFGKIILTIRDGEKMKTYLQVNIPIK